MGAGDSGGRAVVLGGGFAGMLAAAVLAGRPEVSGVTVVEQDPLDDGPAPRRGLPQGWHAHVLMSSGARTVESLLPGTMARWAEAGAHRRGLPDGYVMLMPQGWMRRWTSEQFVISCSRGLLDHVVREQLSALPGVRFLPGTEAVGLCGSARRVDGVRVRRTRTAGPDSTLEAALVVDATGRGSRAPEWLAELGTAAVPQTQVDSGLRYATRLFRAPGRAGTGFPIVNVQADPGLPEPGRTAALMPIEGGKWLVTLSGTRGGEPSSATGDFVAFARRMRHPIVADLIENAEPLGPVRVTNSTGNRYRRFEKLADWPDGFLVMGDAVASLNPVYGHGMAAAAHGAAALRDTLDKAGWQPGAARRAQRAIARTAQDAWLQSTATDVRFPGAVGPAPTAVDRLMNRYQDRVLRAANSRAEMVEQLAAIFTLSAPLTRLMAPHLVLGAMLGPRGPGPAAPPFTAAELDRLEAVPASARRTGAPGTASSP
jgi:2-polyprenyl-6-methoxyphenol hydroxylase-like FAD-dependent oxidoreductase